MPASILVIQRDADSVREGYRAGRVDWAQALPLVLEKLGYLGVECAAPSALRDPRTWQRHAAVLIPELDDGDWDERALELVGSGRAHAFLETPPQPLHARLGVLASEPAGNAGAITAVDQRLAAAVEEMSNRDRTYVEPPQSRPVDRVEEVGWANLDVPITAEQAERWRQPGWRVERWSAAEQAEVLAEWAPTGAAGGWPALVRSGRITAACFSIFQFLGQQHTVQPFAGPEHLIWQRSQALDAMLMALLDQMHQDAGMHRARVLPWPEGARWALNVRHDFDRPQSRRQVESVLAIHAEAGTAATWYWRSCHVSARNAPKTRFRAQGSNGAVVARLVAGSPKSEVALHTEQLWRSAVDERRALEAAIGRRVQGTSAHGDPTCFRWQGAPNVLWAERQGLSYTEFISHSHLIPHRFASLNGDGTIEKLRVVCLPHHESLDRSTKPGDAASDSVLGAAGGYVKSGGLMQVLNHPDLNAEQLRAVLLELPVEGRLDWTAAQAADWWRRTHDGDELQLAESEDGRLEIRSSKGVRGAVVELLAPDGSRQRHSIHIEAGESVTLDLAGHSAPLATAPADANRWDLILGPAFADAARDYYEERGIDPDTASSRSTIATNSTLVPGRVEATRRYLAELGGITSIAGLRVLDCGAGFGAFAAYLASSPEAPLLTAVDSRPEFVQLAAAVAGRVDAGDVQYRDADMRSLEGIDDGSFDLVIVNNAFIYLSSKTDMEDAVAAFFRVLKPGGTLFMFHANRWRLREPFTRAPVVHLLPRSLADPVSRATGWAHSHGRVRLVSPVALGRIQRGAGFEGPELGMLRRGKMVGAPRAYLAKFYAMVSRRPD